VPAGTTLVTPGLEFQLLSVGYSNTNNHERNFVVKCEGDSLVWNQYITKPKEKMWGYMACYIPTVWKSGGTRRPCPPPTCAHANNTIILFATRYKNDNTTFHRSYAVSGGLALLQAFGQWKIEHQVRKRCVKGLIQRKITGRESDTGRLYDSGYKQ